MARLLPYYYQNYKPIKEVKEMRHIITIVLALVLLAACREETSIVNPEDHYNSSIHKTVKSDDGLIYKITKDMNVYLSDFLAPNSDLNGNYQLSYDPDKSVRLTTSYSWNSGPYKGKRFEAEIIVEGRDIDWECGNALIKGQADKRYVTFHVEFDPDLLAVDFQPSPFTFANPVDIDLLWRGIDKNTIKTMRKNHSFGYLDNNGNFLESTPYLEIDFGMGPGSIKVKDAKIPHFSRYGFLR